MTSVAIVGGGSPGMAHAAALTVRGETMDVPDIRVQAAGMAEDIAKELGQ